jgi:hypothetical protein
VFLRRDQLIPVNKAVNEKEQLEKGLEEGEEKKKIKHKNYRKFGFQQIIQTPPPPKKTR